MSPEEHYFENTLYNIAKHGRDGWNNRLSDENRKYLTDEVISAIDACLWYIYDLICDCKQEKVKHIWDGKF